MLCYTFFMSEETKLISPHSQEDIRNKIYTIRGVQVMLDSDLAELYQVEIRVLNQAVKRNIKRFLERYYFQLNETDVEFSKSQFVILNKKTGR